MDVQAEGLVKAIAAHVRRHGSIRFDEFMELALYDPDEGFFATGGGAGRSGADFITSPEVGPLFGAVVARYLDSVWDELGRPDPFVVVEAAAGRGALAVAVLAAEPRCAPALRYVMVERSAELRERQRDHLDVVEPFEVLGPDHDPDGTVAAPGLGVGPLCTSIAELPSVRVAGVLLANELLDNIACRLLERTSDGWSEVFVVAAGRETWRESLVPVGADVAQLVDGWAPDVPVGARIPLQADAAGWLRGALDVVERGRVLVIDYCSTTPELATRDPREWLRTYRGHDHGDEPLDRPGSQDVTVEVAVDQLAGVAAPDVDSAQADWLRDNGIDELVADGRRLWDAAAHAPDLAAIRGRSRAVEADALCEPGGLGAFRVLEWRR